MPQYQNCIHWRVCAMPCPLEINDCRHFKPHEAHGHWKNIQLSLRLPCETALYEGQCSVCERWTAYVGTNIYYFKQVMEYCPHCNAIMDEGSEE